MKGLHWKVAQNKGKKNSNKIWEVFFMGEKPGFISTKKLSVSPKTLWSVLCLLLLWFHPLEIFKYHSEIETQINPNQEFPFRLHKTHTKKWVRVGLGIFGLQVKTLFQTARRGFSLYATACGSVATKSSYSFQTLY